MDEPSALPQSDPPTNLLGDDFYAAALNRIVRNMMFIALVLMVAAFFKLGSRVGIGFMIGCGIAVLNFYAIQQVVAVFADRVTQQQTTKPTGTKFRFALRYVLVGLVVYVIFKSSFASFTALLAGLLLPVPAIFAEAGYEVLVVLRR